jgi:hypothetical protein
VVFLSPSKQIPSSRPTLNDKFERMLEEIVVDFKVLSQTCPNVIKSMSKDRRPRFEL